MRSAWFLLLLTLLSCQSNEKLPANPERTELAIITGNRLASDGCEESVRIDAATASVTYKPTAATLPLIQQALATIPADQRYQADKPVVIRFVETGRQVKLQCGWGTQLDVSEIEILDINNR